LTKQRKLEALCFFILLPGNLSKAKQKHLLAEKQGGVFVNKKASFRWLQ
jgi:hypothetical protein